MISNQSVNLSRFVTHMALGVSVLFGNLTAPAIASLPLIYSPMTQASKSSEDLFSEVANKKDPQKKIEALNLIVQRHPDFANAYIYRGQLYKEQKDYQKAIQDFNRVIALKSKPEQLTVAYYLMGLVNSLLGEYQQAINNYNQAISFYEKSSDWVHPISDIYNKRASIHLLLGNQQQAINDALKAVSYVASIENYTELIKAKPDSEEAYFKRGELYLVRANLNHYINAINTFLKERIVSLDLNRQKSAEIFQKASEDFKKTVQLNPTFSDAEYQLSLSQGLFYFQSDNLKKAVLSLTKTIQLNPNNFDAYYQRGRLLINLKDYSLAFEDFTKVIQIKEYEKIKNPLGHPLNPFSKNPVNNSLPDEGYFSTDVYYQRAITQLKQNNKLGALNDLNWIDTYSLDSIDSLWLRGQIKSELGDKEGAERDIQNAKIFYRIGANRTSDISLDKPCLYSEKAFLSLREGNPESALINLSVSLQLRPDVTDFYISKIYIYSIIGNKEKMIDEYTNLIEYTSEHIHENDLIDIYQKRGDIYTELGNEPKAIKDYSKVEELTLPILQALNRAGSSGYGYAPIGRVCEEHNGTQFAPVLASEKEAKSRLATVYYKRGEIKSKIDKAGAIQDLQKALAIFVEVNDKTNEQKVRLVLKLLV